MTYEKGKKNSRFFLLNLITTKTFFFSSSAYYTYVHLFLCDVTVNRLELND